MKLFLCMPYVMQVGSILIITFTDEKDFLLQFIAACKFDCL
jgi:hypothetical protein